MCKVSTLRHVEPPARRFSYGKNQLPKIKENEEIKAPIAFIDVEGAILEFSLPDLAKEHLPQTLPPLSPKQNLDENFKIGFAEDALKAGLESKENRFPNVKRTGTPFFKGNTITRIQTKDMFNDVAQVAEQRRCSRTETGQNCQNSEKHTRKPKLHASLSLPVMNFQEMSSTEKSLPEIKQRSLDRCLKTPSPPLAKSPKVRPSTPFHSSRGVHLDAKPFRNNLQAWSGPIKKEDQERGEIIKDADYPNTEMGDVYFGRKIDRDKVEMAMLKDEKRLPSKIRMDQAAFKQWIYEQRSP